MQTFKEYCAEKDVRPISGDRIDVYFMDLSEAFQSYVDEVLIPSVKPPLMAGPLDVDVKPGGLTYIDMKPGAIKHRDL